LFNSIFSQLTVCMYHRIWRIYTQNIYSCMHDTVRCWIYINFIGIGYKVYTVYIRIWLHIMYTRYTYWLFTLLTSSIYTLLYIIILIVWHSINAYDKLHCIYIYIKLCNLRIDHYLHFMFIFWTCPYRDARNVIDIPVNRVIGTNIRLQLWISYFTQLAQLAKIDP